MDIYCQIDDHGNEFAKGIPMYDVDIGF